MKTNETKTHRLTWKMYFPVYVNAESKDQAIDKAIATRPACIAKGTELYYGPVGGLPVALAK